MQNHNIGSDTGYGNSTLNKNPFFEWFYFDIHCADSMDIVFTFHTKPFMSHFNVSIFDIFIYRNNQRLVHKFLVIPQDQLHIAPNGDRMQFRSDATLFFERKPEHAKLDIHADWLELNLLLENDQPGAEPLDVHFPSQNKALQSFRWLLFMPQAQASGRLRIKDGKGQWLDINISGHGYHDANQGALNLKKELKSWLWMKIYQKETLWIAGKIVPRNDEVKNILVRVGDRQTDFTTDAHIEMNESRLQFECAWGKWDFELKENYRLDDLRFLVPVWPAALAPLEKVREILAAFTLERKALKPLREWLTNGKYRRYRRLAKDADGHEVEIFGEEMLLND